MTSGRLGVAGEHDWLKISLNQGQAYLVSVTGLSGYATIEIGQADALGEGILASQRNEATFNSFATQSVWFTPAATGAYYVDIADPSLVGASYDVTAVAEPNDFPDNTTTTGVIAVGGAVTNGRLGVAGEHDWLGLALTQGQAYLLTVTGLSGAATITVGQADALAEGIVATQRNEATFNSYSPQTVWFTPATTGTYYVDIADPTTVGAYGVSAITEPNDFPDNTTTTGVVTIGGLATAGRLGVAGEHDWLRVSLIQGQAYLLSITGLTGYATVEIGQSSALAEGIVASQRNETTFNSNAAQTVWFTPATTGTYYLDIADPQTIGTYSVTAVTEPNDFPDNTSTTGVVTVGGAATSGRLGVAGEHDWMRVALTQGQAYLLTVTGLTGAASITVGPAAALAEGIVATQLNTATLNSFATQTVWFTPATTGTYYVDISDPATVGTYGVSAVTETNDFPDNATTTGVIAVNGAATAARLGVAGEHDWLRVALTAGQAYLLTVTGLSGAASIVVGLPDALAAGFVATQLNEPTLNSFPTQTVWFTPATTGSYYVDISDPATVGNYGVSAVTEPNDFPDNTTTTGVVPVACYRAGTRLATPDGARAIEDLVPGDLVRARFAGDVPVRWVGTRRIDCARHPRPAEICPVRIAAGAFGVARPSRDLWLSPDHAVFVDGILVPARLLVNGTSVRQEQVASVTYYHVELDLHDLVLAEGLACESYLERGNRPVFANAGPVIRLHAGFAGGDGDGGCAPLVVSGATLEGVRARLAKCEDDASAQCFTKCAITVAAS